MISRRFRLIYLGRLVALTITLVAAVYLTVTSTMYAVVALLFAVVILQAYSLLRLCETTSRDLTRFLESIEYSDYSQTFTSGLRGRSFDELNAAFSRVMERFRDIRRESQENYRYLQSVVQHIGIGLIAFRDEGAVELVNAAAKRLFDVPGFKDIDALAAISPQLADRIRSLLPGRRDLVTVTRHGELLHLSVYLTELRLRDKRLSLVSFQNISAELNQKEMDAWQNLIRVLTHEIRNSLTPIASLAATVESLLYPDDSGTLRLRVEDATDIREALQTIQKRSQGLLQFVDAYRNLTHIRKPQYQTVAIADLFGHIGSLVEPEIARNRISFHRVVRPQSIRLTADPQLIEQVLINLLVNAIQALEGRPDARIDLDAHIDDKGHTVIQVGDNGPGIDEDAMESIFIPFFTTKKGGSGIGLSLSRQIMRLHRGELVADSGVGGRTTFTMRF
jgi:two-component system, NtrC family, nitrogen regulation sensor histidine kinase NtrY